MYEAAAPVVDPIRGWLQIRVAQPVGASSSSNSGARLGDDEGGGSSWSWRRRCWRGLRRGAPVDEEEQPDVVEEPVVAAPSAAVERVENSVGYGRR
jgi:hypothetical protein